MRVVLSEDFKEELKRIKDKNMRVRINKQLLKLAKDPYCGKPLRNKLKNKRSIRIHPFRIIYEIKDDIVIVLSFGHREEVYAAAS